MMTVTPSRLTVAAPPNLLYAVGSVPPDPDVLVELVVDVASAVQPPAAAVARASAVSQADLRNGMSKTIDSPLRQALTRARKKHDTAVKTTRIRRIAVTWDCRKTGKRRE